MNATMKKVNSMTKAHLNNIMQIMVFKLNDNSLYGINVSKIKSIEDFKRYKLVKNDIGASSKGNLNSVKNSNILEGYINYHDLVIPYLNIEKWLGIFKDGNEYKVTLVSEFNRHTMAFGVSDILNIFNVSINDLQTTHLNKDFITYSALLEIDHAKEICFIVDVENLLQEVFGEKVVVEDHLKNLGFNKEILIAEDSKSAQIIIDDILLETGIKYQKFNNGEELINYISTLDDKQIEQIGLVITDLEMPKKDGYQVISYIKSHDKTKHIPVVVNSSMSNEGVITKTKSVGACGFVTKTNPTKFIEQIKLFMLK
ncbi:MAG: response regulator [Campylobacterales bacterium]|nr:response regulator [Campylobacterales bacterium]